MLPTSKSMPGPLSLTNQPIYLSPTNPPIPSSGLGSGSTPPLPFTNKVTTIPTTVPTISPFDTGGAVTATRIVCMVNEIV